MRISYISNASQIKKIFFPPGKYSFQFKTILENWGIKINLSSYEEEKIKEI